MGGRRLGTSKCATKNAPKRYATKHANKKQTKRKKDCGWDANSFKGSPDRANFTEENSHLLRDIFIVQNDSKCNKIVFSDNLVWTCTEAGLILMDSAQTKPSKQRWKTHLSVLFWIFYQEGDSPLPPKNSGWDRKYSKKIWNYQKFSIEKLPKISIIQQ